MPAYSLVSARSIAGVDSCGSSIGSSDRVSRSNAGRLSQTWTAEHWSRKAAYVAAGVLGRRKAVTEGGVEAVERTMDRRASEERPGAGDDGRHECGPVDSEDGIGYQDAGLRLTLMIADAGSRVGVGLGVV